MTLNTLGKLPRIAVTMGEPAGIGPELLIKAACKAHACELVLIGDKSILASTAEKLNMSVTLVDVDWRKPAQVHVPGRLLVEHIQCGSRVETGTLDPENAESTLAFLNRAHELGASGEVDAIVTAPVHKANLNSHDPEFMGHTEYFAKRAKVDKVVMMLATKSFRVALATTHLPLAEVPKAINKESLGAVLQVILDGLESIVQRPVKVAVCGLNPHAGEDGLLGLEEKQVIEPLLEGFRRQGKSVSGPHPADTLFTPANLAKFDIFLAMYHDQGLPVIKALGFGQCANVTLGLPYIRTSVDHGTALDIAANYSASSESLEFAIDYAIDLANGILPHESF